jgi:hypothetical protein
MKKIDFAKLCQLVSCIDFTEPETYLILFNVDGRDYEAGLCGWCDTDETFKKKLEAYLGCVDDMVYIAERYDGITGVTLGLFDPDGVDKKEIGEILAAKCGITEDSVIGLEEDQYRDADAYGIFDEFGVGNCLEGFEWIPMLTKEDLACELIIEIEKTEIEDGEDVDGKEEVEEKSVLSEEFKEYYKFPLKMWNDFAVKVFTNDNCMAFDWLLPGNEKYDQVKVKLLDALNGGDVKFQVRKRFSYNRENGRIRVRIEEGEHAGAEQNVCLIRGWGMLTGVGGYNLDADKAAEIQDSFAEYCVNIWNNANA